tara:strand:+ start:48297 stop:49259 length:963 start_codon:yes stop_codon:yes gene_type:complete
MFHNNPICQLLDIQYPIFSAPMANVSGGELAKAVTEAGGLGFIGVGYSSAEWLEQQLALVENTEFGVGFINWYLAEHPELLDCALAVNPKAVMLSFGDAGPFIKQVKAAGSKVICQITNVQEAIAVEKLGADAIVAQGREAGGHCAAQAESTMTLVKAVVEQVTVPVVAAGGIADAQGYQIALAAGASGIMMGTRFYASTEALGVDAAKQKIVDAKASDLTYTDTIDKLRNTVWPNAYTGHAIKNNFLEQFLASTIITEQDREAYQAAAQTKDYDITAVFAGESVEKIETILPAKTIIDQIVNYIPEENNIVKNSGHSIG